MIAKIVAGLLVSAGLGASGLAWATTGDRVGRELLRPGGRVLLPRVAVLSGELL